MSDLGYEGIFHRPKPWRDARQTKLINGEALFWRRDTLARFAPLGTGAAGAIHYEDVLEQQLRLNPEAHHPAILRHAEKHATRALGGGKGVTYAVLAPLAPIVRPAGDAAATTDASAGAAGGAGGPAARGGAGAGAGAGVPGLPLVFATSHISCAYETPVMQVLQTRCLVEVCSALRTRAAGAAGVPVAAVPAVFMGDFNVKPGSGTYALLAEGRLQPEHPDVAFSMARLPRGLKYEDARGTVRGVLPALAERKAAPLPAGAMRGGRRGGGAAGGNGGAGGERHIAREWHFDPLALPEGFAIASAYVLGEGREPPVTNFKYNPFPPSEEAVAAAAEAAGGADGEEGDEDGDAVAVAAAAGDAAGQDAERAGIEAALVQLRGRAWISTARRGAAGGLSDSDVEDGDDSDMAFSDDEGTAPAVATAFAAAVEGPPAITSGPAAMPVAAAGGGHALHHNPALDAGVPGTGAVLGPAPSGILGYIGAAAPSKDATVMSLFADTLDYVWLTPAASRSLRVTATLPCPPLDCLMEEAGLPNARWPSDHLPIGVVLRMKLQ